MWSLRRATLVLIAVFIGIPVALFYASTELMEYANCRTRVTELPYPAGLRESGKSYDFDVTISKKACKAGDGTLHITQVALRKRGVFTLGFSQARPDFKVDTFFEFHGLGEVTPQWMDSRTLSMEHDVVPERISRQAIIWSDAKIEYRRKE